MGQGYDTLIVRTELLMLYQLYYTGISVDLHFWCNEIHYISYI